MTDAAMRLDVWLDLSCLSKTRSEAQRACRAGRVSVNGQLAKPHRLLKVGDELQLERGNGRVQTVAVLALVAHNVAKAEARLLYEDRTPPPTLEEVDARHLARLVRESRPWPEAAPESRDRHALRRLSGKE